jgi:hypothetical protein
LGLKEIGNTLRKGKGSVPGEEYLRGSMVALTAFVAFELAVASLLLVMGVWFWVWGRHLWPEDRDGQCQDLEA